MDKEGREERKGVRVLVKDFQELKKIARCVDGGLEGILRDFERIEKVPKANETRGDLGVGSGVGRIHFEMGVVCQSGGIGWRDKRRIVWGPNEDGLCVLYVGYEEDHESEHGRNGKKNYKELKEKAGNLTEEDFSEALEVCKAIEAEKMGTKEAEEAVNESKEKTPLEKLLDIRDLVLDPAYELSDEEKIKELKAAVEQLYGDLSNKQKRDLKNLKKTDLLRVAYDEVVSEKEGNKKSEATLDASDKSQTDLLHGKSDELVSEKEGDKKSETDFKAPEKTQQEKTQNEEKARVVGYSLASYFRERGIRRLKTRKCTSFSGRLRREGIRKCTSKSRFRGILRRERE